MKGNLEGGGVLSVATRVSKKKSPKKKKKKSEAASFLLNGYEQRNHCGVIGRWWN